MDIAQIGATKKGGSCRLTLTDEDVAARKLFISWCEQAGCEVYFDRVGNIFARRPGLDPDAPVVMCGSHLDTQPTGGRFDGVYGVLAGLEAIRSLNDSGIKTRHPIEVVSWINEEGSRFSPGMLGSGVYSGKFPVDFALERACVHTGVLLGDELARTGFAATPLYSGAPKAYFEAHIEQGPIMEQANVSIGVVTCVQGITWIEVTVTGMESHAGTTPMPVRKDAMVGAADMISQFTAFCAQAEPDVRVTVGRFTCYPNSPSTIPGKVSFTVDLRHPDGATLLRMQHAIADICKRAASHARVDVDVAITASYDPVVFDSGCVNQVRDAASSLGFPHIDIVSGAGHDAVYVSHVAPAAMIFVPCKNGISHNEAEYAQPDHLAMGASVLANVVLGQAQVA